MLNEEGKRVIHVLTQERPAVALLTGPAGTGKSTLIQRMREEVFPGMLLAAPTGIAALNIRGQTLHSLFRLPLGPLIPGDERIYKLRFRREQLQLFRKMDLLVIDEISMVRADTLDAVDAVLRMVMGKDEPFGGKRVLLCGDPFQLPPVVTGSELPLIREYYDAPYFFKAKVLEETGFGIYAVNGPNYELGEFTVVIDMIDNTIYEVGSDTRVEWKDFVQAYNPKVYAEISAGNGSSSA